MRSPAIAAHCLFDRQRQEDEKRCRGLIRANVAIRLANAIAILRTCHAVLRLVVHRRSFAGGVIAGVYGRTAHIEREVGWGADERAQVGVLADDVPVRAVGQVAGARAFDEVVYAQAAQHPHAISAGAVGDDGVFERCCGTVDVDSAAEVAGAVIGERGVGDAQCAGVVHASAADAGAEGVVA